MVVVTDDMRLEEWKTAREVLRQFDDRIHELRKHGFTVVTTLLTINSFLLTASIVPAPSGGTESLPDLTKVAVVGAVMVLVVGLRYMERNYQMFNQAAATRARILERCLNLELTEKISDWKRSGKMWPADAVYFLFAVAASVLGLATVSSSLFRSVLLLLLLVVFVVLSIMARFLKLTPGWGDLTFDRIQCRPGEDVTFMLTCFEEDEPFKTDSIMFHVGMQDSEVREPFHWPTDQQKLSRWIPNPTDHSLYTYLRNLRRNLNRKYFADHSRAFINDPRILFATLHIFVGKNRTRRESARQLHRRTAVARQVYPDWTGSSADLRNLIWLGSMDDYVWVWHTAGLPPGIFWVVPYGRASQNPLQPLPAKIVIARESEVLTDPIKFTTVNQTGPGTSTIVGAVAGRKIRVVGFSLCLTVSGTVKFLNTGGPDLTGVMNWGTAVASYYAPKAPAFETAASSGLDIMTTLGAAKGHLTYVEV